MSAVGFWELSILLILLVLGILAGAIVLIVKIGSRRSKSSEQDTQ